MSKYVTVSTTNTWDTKYVTVSKTWARKDTVTSYLTKYTLCTGTPALTVHLVRSLQIFSINSFQSDGILTLVSSTTLLLRYTKAIMVFVTLSSVECFGHHMVGESLKGNT